MVRFKNFISEGVSPILFHHTSVDKLLSILKDDKFRLGTDLGTGSDQRHKGAKFKPYFFSCSRSKFGGYARGFSERHDQVNLVLDGVKLSHNLSGHSVDYWGPEFRKPHIDVNSRLRNDENEDRLFSPNPTIEHASEYIKEIHVLIDRNSALIYTNYSEYEGLDDNDRSRAFQRNQMYDKVMQYADVLKIPIFFYLDFNSFKVMDKRKATDQLKPRSNKIEDLCELFALDSQSQLSARADKTRYNLVYHNWGNDFVRGLDADIHNGKTNEIEQRSIAKLIRWMQKFRLKSTAEVVEFLSKKWIEIRDREKQ